MTATDRKRICILAFSPIKSDARVLRQIEYLASDYDLVVIGYGEPNPGWSASVVWLPVEARTSFFSKALSLLLLILGRIFPASYDRWYWRKSHHRQALDHAMSHACDAYHSNDWNTLPIAVRAARAHSAKVVFDAHEYAPEEEAHRLIWRILYSPMIIAFLKKYSPQVKKSVTIAPLIADRYRKEYRLDPIVVMNAPKLALVDSHDVDINNVRLVHHGGASRGRQLELMIETLSLTDTRFSLHFMLTGSDVAYIEQLRKLASQLEDGRVVFHEPVPPSNVVNYISQFDLGFYLLKPTNYNNAVALPNKLFDFLVAGLGICTGPTPGMAAVVHEFGCGVVTSTFLPIDVARTLNELTVKDIQSVRQAALNVTHNINADLEMKKLEDLYKDLLNNPNGKL